MNELSSRGCGGGRGTGVGAAGGDLTGGALNAKSEVALTMFDVLTAAGIGDWMETAVCDAGNLCGDEYGSRCKTGRCKSGC
jgi:hypothetical protein